MIAMQYNIKLPSDYDMNIIKDRVKNNGFKTDCFRDLLMKAYLIAEKGQLRSSCARMTHGANHIRIKHYLFPSVQ
jgi:adenosine deaminase